MTVWIVMGEYALTENGESAWIEAVCKSRSGARAAATTAALGDDFKERKVTVDGIMMPGTGWTEEELEEAEDMDWEVCFSLEQWEVQD